MRKRIIGSILVIVGFYLLVFNPIMSILFNYAGPIGFDVPISVEDYWRNWFNNYGIITFGIAGIGLCLLIIGLVYLQKKKVNTSLVQKFQ
ncbi:MAG: hypothetical protein ACFFE5_12405 [Candidatus Thorarchaeota archaeon]